MSRLVGKSTRVIADMHDENPPPYRGNNTLSDLLSGMHPAAGEEGQADFEISINQDQAFILIAPTFGHKCGDPNCVAEDNPLEVGGSSNMVYGLTAYEAWNMLRAMVEDIEADSPQLRSMGLIREIENLS